MVLLQYYNLLLHRVNESIQMEIIGEDKGAPLAVNASLPTDDNELREYKTHFMGVKHLVCKFKELAHLPPPVAGFLDELVVLDISNCSLITRIPSAFGERGTVKTLKLSGTKISSIPLTFAATVEALDVSSCRRITNVGDMHNLKILNISASAVLDISMSIAATLEQLLALNCKVTSISDAVCLKVVVWSGSLQAKLSIDGSHSLMSVVTTGSVDCISCDGSAYITTLNI